MFCYIGENQQNLSHLINKMVNINRKCARKEQNELHCMFHDVSSN